MSGGFLGHSLSWIEWATYHTPQSQAVHIESKKGWREFCASRRLGGSTRPMPSSPSLAVGKMDPQEETVAGNPEFPGKWDWESSAFRAVVAIKQQPKCPK